MKTSSHIVLFISCEWSTIGVPAGIDMRHKLERFILWDVTSRKIIVVEAPWLCAAVSPGSERDSIRAEYIEKLSVCVKSLDLTLDTRVYLVEAPSGPRTIQKPLRRNFKYDSLLAPRVDLRDLDIQSVLFDGAVFGSAIWRGQEFTCNIAYDEKSFGIMKMYMIGYRLVQDLDIAFQIVAHIFEGDLLIGYLTESVKGSRASDRAVVYAAIARIERAFIVHRGIDDPIGLLIDPRGKVRLRHSHMFYRYDENTRAKFEKACKKYHWDVLPAFFRGMTPRRVVSHNQCLAAAWNDESIWLSQIPRPAVPISISSPYGPRQNFFRNLAQPSRRLVSKATRTKSNSKQITLGPAGTSISKRGNEASKQTRDTEEDDQPLNSRYPAELSCITIFDEEIREESTASIVEL
ncbi:hypothetical protein C8F01DRAFT_1190518 [Mycena amicta]|nr:hypothetical protein C8F01DRAFT_1190518 [Mycena amicta]